MFRNLIFDWSGTLVDDLGPVIEATNAVLARYGLDGLDRENFRRKFRLPYSEFYHELLPDAPLDELEHHFRLAVDAAETPVTVLPHAREKLEWCARHGIRMFVLSAMDATAFERQMHDFGFARFFEATYAGVLDKRALIHTILESHSLHPEETAFVGDMTHDVETARHGGIASIAVLTGYNHAEVLAKVRPDLTVPDLGVLRALLDRKRRSSSQHSVCVAQAPDVIEIRRMEVSAFVGVPDEERAARQSLWISIRMTPQKGFYELEDDLEKTVDYHAVYVDVTALVEVRPRKLIETLAGEIAETLLAQYPLASIAVEIEKKILPHTDCVVVRTERSTRPS